MYSQFNSCLNNTALFCILCIQQTLWAEATFHPAKDGFLRNNTELDI